MEVKMGKEELNEETQELYWFMYEITHRKYSKDKSLLFEAAREMISAIDEQGNLPSKY